MQQVYFVRHCTSDPSVHEESIRPLSEKGRQEAAALVDFFKDIPVSRVISSPYLRAMETVKGIAAGHGLSVDTDDDLRERTVGVWVEDFWEFARHQWEDFDFSIPGGESLREVMRRYLMALGRILDGSSDIAVCGTHGTALSVLIHAYDENFGYEDFMKIVDKMPWIVKFTFDGSRLVGWETVELGDKQ